MIFRRAVVDDVPAIVAMLADDHLGSGREDLSEAALQRYLEGFAAVDGDPNQLLAVAEDGGEVVGCLQISFLPGLSRQGMWRGQIESVRTAGNRRGQGIGAAFVTWALDRCRDRNCGLVQLTTHKSRTAAHRFYERLGFEKSHVGMKVEL